LVVGGAGASGNAITAMLFANSGEASDGG